MEISPSSVPAITARPLSTDGFRAEPAVSEVFFLLSDFPDGYREDGNSTDMKIQNNKTAPCTGSLLKAIFNTRFDLSFSFFVNRQKFVQFALKVAQAFFHVIDALYGVFHLPVQKALAGFVQEGIKRKVGNRRGFFFGHYITVIVHVLSLIIEDAFDRGLPGQIMQFHISIGFIKSPDKSNHCNKRNE
jgi:hypothetical protein